MAQSPQKTTQNHPHLRLLLISHEKLLLADPHLSLASIQVVLLGFAGLLQPLLPSGHFFPQRLPLCPQFPCLLCQLRAGSFSCRLTAFQHLGQAGGMALQLLLKGLQWGQNLMGCLRYRTPMGRTACAMAAYSPHSSWPNAAGSGGWCHAQLTWPIASSPAPITEDESTCSALSPALQPQPCSLCCHHGAHHLVL